MLYTSYIAISKKALRHNIRYLKRKVRGNARFSSVVKGNAYGHGIEQFVPIAEEMGVDHFSVFNADEAARVLEVKKEKCDVMIMGMIDNEDLEWAVANDIEFFVFDLDRLEGAVEAAKNVGKPARIHIEVETGMNRTGFNKKQLKEVVKIIEGDREHLVIEGFCTHFAGAESVNNYLRIQNQMSIYDDLYEWFVAQGIRPKYRHTACSAAVLNYPGTCMDMVRVGIAQYGFWPSKETFIRHVEYSRGRAKNPMKPIISWKSRVMSLKKINTGEFVGYGSAFLAGEDIQIATVPVGYAHGFSRSLSNQGRVLIRGHRVQVVGMVNMNMMSVNVTNVPSIQKGDEVVLIGKQKNLRITVASFGEMSDQLNYELLTRLPQDIPRKVVE